LAHNIVPSQYREGRGDGVGAVFERKEFSTSSIGRFIFEFGRRRRSETNSRRAQAIRGPRPGAACSRPNALRMAHFERLIDGFRTPSHQLGVHFGRVAHQHTPAIRRRPLRIASRTRPISSPLFGGFARFRAGISTVPGLASLPDVLRGYFVCRVSEWRLLTVAAREIWSLLHLTPRSARARGVLRRSTAVLHERQPS
jgi:hypothetical protein